MVQSQNRPLILLVMSYDAVAQGADMVIPAPEEVLYAEGVYRFEDSPKITYKISKKMVPEAYCLEVCKNGIIITSSDDAGAFYAQQTLAQMITEKDGAREVECCVVNDCPRFSYRGLHFDVSRHFRSVDFLKKQIDAMAMFKMNRMHLHLTDAAGWRLQIDAYPRLTSFAAWRPQPAWKEWWAGKRLYADEGEEGSFGGYYTKEQMRELIELDLSKHGNNMLIDPIFVAWAGCFPNGLLTVILIPQIHPFTEAHT